MAYEGKTAAVDNRSARATNFMANFLRVLCTQLAKVSSVQGGREKEIRGYEVPERLRVPTEATVALRQKNGGDRNGHDFSIASEIRPVRQNSFGGGERSVLLNLELPCDHAHRGHLTLSRRAGSQEASASSPNIFPAPAQSDGATSSKIT